MDRLAPFSTGDALPPALRPFAAMLDAATGLARLQQLYPEAASSGDFITAALRVLDIAVDVDKEGLAHVPLEGPLVVAANHPHGAADGLALAAILRRVRPDVKLLANELLARIPEMRPHLLAVDVFAGGGGNGAALRAAIDWVREGHVLVVFPAGAVAHVAAGRGRVVDSRWRTGAARIATGADAPVLPVFIDGRNSAAFLAAGRLHPLLRTALLARELLRLRRSRLTLRLGRAVSARRLAALGDAAAQTAYVRARCYSLADTAAAAGPLRLLRGAGAVVPVADAVRADLVAGEIAALPAAAILVENGPWTVVCARADAMPHALAEIGRLRELTFRGVGEGTGRATDLDRYDAHYEHLFVWHQERRAIAGAYRVARSDRVLHEHGPNGLYTRSLFRYRRQLLRELGPSLELGRSFVAPEFQRDYQPLLLLWRGIGRLVAREPRYRRLFGPVSISADYGMITRQILARFLLANRYRADLGSLVRPKRPLPIDRHHVTDALVRSTVAGRLEEVEQIVRDLESGQRGMPVLLRQYLKLNAKLLGFSVDPAFGHVLDGLVVVDLLDVERSLLIRYLGKDGAAAFLAFHRGAEDAARTLAVARLS